MVVIKKSKKQDDFEDYKKFNENRANTILTGGKKSDILAGESTGNGKNL